MASPRALKDYLAAFDAGARVEVFIGDPTIRGKYYYNPGLQGFNFERRMMKLIDAVDCILEAVDHPGARSVYVGSVPAGDCLPGFAADNSMPLPVSGAGPRIWLGTAANISSHYDTFDNLACVIAGRRRFTLYAPELIGRLYVGPLDNTMSGPPVSLAASAPAGSETQFPLFEEIRDQALTGGARARRRAVPTEALVAPGGVDRARSMGWSTTGGTHSASVPTHPTPPSFSA